MDDSHTLAQDVGRLRAREAQEARHWRYQLLVWGVPALLAVLLLSAVLVPRVMATHEPLCTLAGASWYDSPSAGPTCWFRAWW